VSVLLGVFSLVATSVLALTLEARAAELTAHGVALPAPLPALGHWIVFGLLLWLQCALLSAVVLLIASLTESALLTTLLAGLIWLAGQFQPVAREIYAQADSAWWRFGVRALAGIIPNLRLLPETELATRETGAWLAALSRATPYALGYIGVAGSLAAWRF